MVVVCARPHGHLAKPRSTCCYVVYGDMYICMCIYIYICTKLYIYIYMYIYVYVHLYVYQVTKRLHSDIQGYVRIYTYTKKGCVRGLRFRVVWGLLCSRASGLE